MLDMGTGSGICAVFAARYAGASWRWTSIAEAVRCAGINAQLNHLEHRIEIRQGDLFAPVGA